MKKILLTILIILLSLNLSYAKSEPKADVKIGVLAKRGVDKAIEQWAPTGEYLNNYYPQYNFIIVPMKFDDIPLLVSNSLVDFVIVNPGIYVDLNVKYGINRISTLKNRLSSNKDITKFGSVIFVKKDSPINTRDDFKGKSIAAVHKTSFGGWIIAKREIEDAGVSIDDFKRLSFLNTHDSVVKSILNEEYDVGIVRTDTLERMTKEKKIDLYDLKIIHKQTHKNFPFISSSRLYPEWPIAKLLNTDNKIAKDVVLALMNMKPDSIAAKSSNTNGWSIPEDYTIVNDILKMMNLPPYEDYNKITLKSLFMQHWIGLILLFITIVTMSSIIIYSLKLNKKYKKQQNVLVKNEKRFRSTFDQAGIGIIHMSFDGDFISVNQQFCQLIKTSCIETKKVNFSEYIYSLDLAKIINAIELLKNNGERKSELNLRLITSKNEILWVVITLSKVTESSTTESYIVATIVDISEIKKLEAKLEYEKHQKDIILDNAGDGILGLDEMARHTFVNKEAAKLLGYEISEMISKDSHEMWHHSYEDGTKYLNSKCPITSVLNNGVTQRKENEVFWKKDGTALHVDFTSTPIKENNKIVGAVVIFRKTNLLNNKD